jgi:hypothetical protein
MEAPRIHDALTEIKNFQSWRFLGFHDALTEIKKSLWPHFARQKE